MRSVARFHATYVGEFIDIHLMIPNWLDDKKGLDLRVHSLCYAIDVLRRRSCSYM